MAKRNSRKLQERGRTGWLLGAARNVVLCPRTFDDIDHPASPNTQDEYARKMHTLGPRIGVLEIDEFQRLQAELED